MTPKEHLEVTLKLWYSTITELESMKEFINIEKLNDQFYRRLFLRNIFSIIETYLFVTKELIKSGTTNTCTDEQELHMRHSQWDE